MKIFKANGTYVWLKIKMFSTISKVLFQRDCAQNQLIQCKETLVQSRVHTWASTNTNKASKFVFTSIKHYSSADLQPLHQFVSVVRINGQSVEHQNVRYHSIRGFLPCTNRHETQPMIQSLVDDDKYISSNANSGSNVFMWSGTRRGYRTHQEICKNYITWLLIKLVGQRIMKKLHKLDQSYWVPKNIKIKQFSPTKPTLFASQVQYYVPLTVHTKQRHSDTSPFG
jgi:hypothetical protein